MLKSPVFEISVTGDYHSLILSQKIVEPFIKKKFKRVRAVAKFEGRELTFHAAIQKIHGQYCMMFGKRYQKELGIFPNDIFKLQFFEDTSKYGVEVPEEFEAVMLSDYDAYQIFESLTDGRKRGLIYTITRYKNSQTKIDKTLLLCENLKRGIRDPKELFKS
ncbi:YdeI/OmpD-associated family protein [Croceitalea rosinachiae]|uniref:YdeI/OmpD-associated family protein n=1 Tax=Croceitalea rosinachiae TaxID=3075596 RepID=A0ABU3AE17_9FLAO|nr:YdeI/OmpD-associated family protein [Croceitalea sp. F388]MDT0607126.1 YdeI/OmpD-associated family protein [Croceitalea sp. F388]